MATGLSSGQKPTGVADLDSSQTLQNKTLDASNAINGAPVTGSDVINPSRLDVKKDTQANLVTYASTASNGQIVYATDSKKMFQVQESALAEIGSGAGGINYISNPDFEVNADGWTGDTNLTIARSAVSPLRGDASGVVSKSAINANGQSVKIPFTIDTADLAKKLYISLDKDASDANYADADLRLEIIKDPNGTPVTIRCNAEDLLGGKGSHLAWFQSDAAILEYELVIKCNSVNALAYSVKIDNVSVGPREVSYGGAMTDWVDLGSITIGATTTPPTKGTIVRDSMKWRRVGDSMEIQYEYEQSTAGSAGSGTYLFPIPNGLTIDTSKLSVTTSSEITVGTFMYSNSATAEGATTLQGWVVPYNSTNLKMTVNSASAGNVISTPTVVGATINLNQASVVFTFKATVPIQGWSSNSVQSEDIGNREIRVRGVGNAGTALSVSVNMDFIEVEDTTGSWNGTQFTAPEKGDYQIDGSMFITSAINQTIYAYIDGVEDKKIGGNVGAEVTYQLNGIFSLNKGQVLSFRASSGTLNNNPKLHYIHIQKLAQPQTILETETVAARYMSDAGYTIPSAVTTTTSFEDKDHDTHGAYNVSTGEYIIPVTGLYSIKSRIDFVGFAAVATLGIYIYVNGIERSAKFELSTAATSFPWGLDITDDLELNVNDIVTIRVFQNTGSTRSRSTNLGANIFSIARIK